MDERIAARRPPAVTPEVEAYLEKATEDLADARKIMTIPLPKAAARSAYYVAFHATEALLLARTGRIAKTHTGLGPRWPSCCSMRRATIAGC